MPRVARIYRAFGYYHATLDAVSLRWASEGDEVVLTFHVTEGPPTILERMTLVGQDELPSPVRADVREALRIAEGRRITEDDWDATRDGLRRVLRNSGFDRVGRGDRERRPRDRHRHGRAAPGPVRRRTSARC
ncbi:MAG: hypothetical protein M0C28_11230 [Candidatus Moduliflexus flocculans]|nr:hypothetical protein [Candidatus Moduliflexus flocculans]